MSKLSTISVLLKKIVRFGPLIPIGNVITTLGRRVLSDDILSKISSLRNKRIQSKLELLVDTVISEYTEECSDGSVSPVQEPIWVCWLQGEAHMPQIPRMCLDSIKKNSNNHPVIVITLQNYMNYVNLTPNIISKYHKGYIKNCHFADILRVNLLAQRGGLWMDATLFCTAPISKDFFSNEFYTIKTFPFGHFVSQCRWAVFCLYAKKGNRLFVMLMNLFERYIEQEDYFIDYFLFDQFISMLYVRDVKIRKMIDDIPFNNPNISLMARKLSQKYDAQEWGKLSHSTSIFKLDWKLYNDDNLQSLPNDTYYKYLKSQSV